MFSIEDSRRVLTLVKGRARFDNAKFIRALLMSVIGRRRERNQGCEARRDDGEINTAGACKRCSHACTIGAHPPVEFTLA